MADIAERLGVEDNGLEALNVAVLNGPKQVGPVSGRAPDFGGLGIGLTAQDAALDVEHIWAGRVEVIVKLLGNLDVGGHD